MRKKSFLHSLFKEKAEATVHVPKIYMLRRISKNILFGKSSTSNMTHNSYNLHFFLTSFTQPYKSITLL